MRARLRMAQPAVSERRDGWPSRRGMAMSDSYLGPAGHPTERWWGWPRHGETCAPRFATSRPSTPRQPAVPTLLLQGETGTGKGLRRTSSTTVGRGRGPFIEVNCAAIPESMLRGGTVWL
jgi:hypothetical protein